MKYPNLTLFFLILIITAYLFQAGIFEKLVNDFVRFRYSGVFLAGAFFVSTFTVAPATVVLFLFAGKLDPILVSLAAGFGAVAGDYIIFRFIKEGLVDELKKIFQFPKQIAQSKYFLWLSPVIGALIIASPLPDELGVGLLGIYKLDNKSFLILSWVLNTVGIFLLLGGLRLLFD